MKHYLLIGAGGHARVIADTLSASEPDAKIVMLDAQYPDLKENGGFRVVGTPEQLTDFKDSHPVGLAAVGDATLRLRFIDLLQKRGFEVPALVHPTAWVSTRARLEPGTVVLAGAVVQTGAHIERGCIINTGASADHDCHLSEGVHLAPGVRLAGGVRVGARTLIGIGAVVKEYTSIGRDVRVGAGAAVVRDVNNGQTAVGVPAVSKEAHEP